MKKTFFLAFFVLFVLPSQGTETLEPASAPEAVQAEAVAPLKKIFITVDDGPSANTKNLVDFLKKNGIPAVFFFIGVHIERFRDAALYAVQNGFLIGNHSWSHTLFSKMTLEKCKEEILKTEKIIDVVYKKAGIARPFKMFRFPGGDTGGAHRQALQIFLKEHGFVSWTSNVQRGPQVHWTWDFQDYRYKHNAPLDGFLERIKKYWESDWSHKKRAFETVLTHDFPRTKQLLEAFLGFLIENKAEFVDPMPFLDTLRRPNPQSEPAASCSEGASGAGSVRGQCPKPLETTSVPLAS